RRTGGSFARSSDERMTPSLGIGGQVLKVGEIGIGPDVVALFEESHFRKLQIAAWGSFPVRTLQRDRTVLVLTSAATSALGHNPKWLVSHVCSAPVGQAMDESAVTLRGLRLVPDF